MINENQVLVECDECGHSETVPYYGYYNELIRDGWNFGKKDLCPTCHKDLIKNRDISEEWNDAV